MPYIKGISIEIDGNTTKLNKALQNSNSAIAQSQSNLKVLNKLLKLDPKNVEALTQKQQNLKDEIKAVEEKLKLEKTALEQAMNSGDDSAGAIQAQKNLKAEIANTEGQLKSLQDEYDETEKSSKKMSKSATADTKKIIESNKKLLKSISSLVVAGVGAVAGLVTKSIEAYSQYEQLVGGVETLFGTSGKNISDYAKDVGKSVSQIKDEYKLLEKAQSVVMKNSANAYMTAGMSQNKYIETVTGFAAALKQSTKDEIEAAKVADAAVIQIADNFNKMGTPLESIQLAYQGFAKQQYGLLDNLKLGYGGTKKEMKRLLLDATKITGVKYDIKNLSDVYTAIGVIQDKLKITGTTAKEAKSTIEGSKNAMKAAGENWLIGISDPAQDMQKLTQNLIDTTKTYAGNLLPRIGESLQGIGSTLSGSIPNWETWKNILIVLGSTIAGVTAGMLVYNTVQAIKTAVDAAGAASVWALVSANLALIAPYVAIGAAIGAVIAVVILLIKHWDWVEEKGKEAGEFIKNKWTEATDKAKEKNEAFKENTKATFQEVSDSIKTKWTEATDKAKERNEAFKENTKTAFNNIINFFKNNWKSLLLLIVNPFAGAFSLVYKNNDEFKKKIDNLLNSIKTKFTNLKGNAKTWGKDMIQGFIDGIKKKISALSTTVKNVAKIIWEQLHFSVPEKGPLADADTWMPDFMNLLTSGIDKGIPNISDKMQKLAASMANPVILTTANAPVQSNTASTDITAVVTLLSRYLPELSKKQDVTIDGKTLVGYVNRELGELI